MALPANVLMQLKAAIGKYDSQISELTSEIQRAQRAGIDVSALQTKLAQLNDTVRKLKLQYPEASQ